MATTLEKATGAVSTDLALARIDFTPAEFDGLKPRGISRTLAGKRADLYLGLLRGSYGHWWLTGRADRVAPFTFRHDGCAYEAAAPPYPNAKLIESQRRTLSDGRELVVGLFGTPNRSSGRRFRVEVFGAECLFDSGECYNLANAAAALASWTDEFLAATGLTIVGTDERG